MHVDTVDDMHVDTYVETMRNQAADVARREADGIVLVLEDLQFKITCWLSSCRKALKPHIASLGHMYTICSIPSTTYNRHHTYLTLPFDSH